MLLQDEVVAPLLDDVGLNRAARRTEVVEAGDTTIDVKRGPQKEPPRQDIFHSGAGERVVLLLLGGLLETRVRGVCETRSPIKAERETLTSFSS